MPHRSAGPTEAGSRSADFLAPPPTCLLAAGEPTSTRLNRPCGPEAGGGGPWPLRKSDVRRASPSPPAGRASNAHVLLTERLATRCREDFQQSKRLPGCVQVQTGQDCSRGEMSRPERKSGVAAFYHQFTVSTFDRSPENSNCTWWTPGLIFGSYSSNDRNVPQIPTTCMRSPSTRWPPLCHL